MQSTSSKPPFSQKKNLIYFILAVLVLLSVSLGSFFVFMHFGVPDEIAKNLVAIIVYPVLGAAIWLGGLNLLGLNTRGKRTIGVLICLCYLIRPIATLGLQQLGISQKVASLIGIWAPLLVVTAIALGVYNKIRKQ